MVNVVRNSSNMFLLNLHNKNQGNFGDNLILLLKKTIDRDLVGRFLFCQNRKGGFVKNFEKYEKLKKLNEREEAAERQGLPDIILQIIQ